MIYVLAVTNAIEVSFTNATELCTLIHIIANENIQYFQVEDGSNRLIRMAFSQHNYMSHIRALKLVRSLPKRLSWISLEVLFPSKYKLKQFSNLRYIIPF